MGQYGCLAGTPNKISSVSVTLVPGTTRCQTETAGGTTSSVQRKDSPTRKSKGPTVPIANTYAKYDICMYRYIYDICTVLKKHTVNDTMRFATTPETLPEPELRAALNHCGAHLGTESKLAAGGGKQNCIKKFPFAHHLYAQFPKSSALGAEAGTHRHTFCRSKLFVLDEVCSNGRYPRNREIGWQSPKRIRFGSGMEPDEPVVLSRPSHSCWLSFSAQKKPAAFYPNSCPLPMRGRALDFLESLQTRQLTS